jgi:hypothetical protein
MTEKSSQPQVGSVERQPMVYEDFNIRFSGCNKADGTLKVWVEGDAPNGSMMKPDDAAVCRYDPAAFWDDVESYSDGLVGRLEDRDLSPEEVLQLGILLADLALPSYRPDRPSQVRSLFEKNLAALEANGKGMRLRLRIDSPALAQLPWEYMALPRASGEPQPDDFFALRRTISIVRTDTVEASQRKLPDRDAALIVGVLASPKDQDKLAVNDDKTAITGAVEGLNNQARQRGSAKDAVKLTWAPRPSTRAALTQALAAGADIFHFAGHGIFDLISHKGRLILEREDKTSDFYPGEDLAQLLGDAGVRLAVLGACETGRRNGQNVWSGVAPALTRQKIPAVVAGQFKIKDDSAKLLAEMIYPLLFAGYTIDEAIFTARQAILQAKGLENRDWGVPVVYLQSKGQILFPKPAAGTGDSAGAGPFVEVANTFGEVAGEVIDVVIGEMKGGRLNVSDNIDTVKGKFTSVKIDKLG